MTWLGKLAPAMHTVSQSAAAGGGDPDLVFFIPYSGSSPDATVGGGVLTPRNTNGTPTFASNYVIFNNANSYDYNVVDNMDTIIDEGSIEMWVRWPSTAPSVNLAGTFIGDGTGPGASNAWPGYRTEFRFHNTANQFRMHWGEDDGTGQTPSFTAGVNLDDNVWHVVHVAWDGAAGGAGAWTLDAWIDGTHYAGISGGNGNRDAAPLTSGLNVVWRSGQNIDRSSNGHIGHMRDVSFWDVRQHTSGSNYTP